MTRKEINDFKTSAVGAIDGGRLCEAIRMVRELPSDIVSYGVRRSLTMQLSIIATCCGILLMVQQTRRVTRITTTCVQIYA